MEIANEISEKIKSAITAKLVDLEAYVDNELPDYIMVMVANRKTKEQMADDLKLFLGANTDVFTTWLDALLKKLKTISDDQETSTGNKDIPIAQEVVVAKKPTGTKDKADGVPYELVQPKVEPSGSKQDNPAAEITLMPEGDDFDEVEDKDKKTTDSKGKSRSRASSQHERKRTSSNSEEGPGGKKIIVERREGIAVKSKRRGSKDRERSRTSVKKRLGSTVGEVFKRFESDEDSDQEEYDPTKPMIGKVASKVAIRGRRSGLPADQQANKSLIMKAMSAAHKSVDSRRRHRSRSNSRERAVESAVNSHVKSRIGRRESSRYLRDDRDRDRDRYRSDRDRDNRYRSDREYHRERRDSDRGRGHGDLRDKVNRAKNRERTYRRDRSSERHRSLSPAETRKVQVHRSPDRARRHSTDSLELKSDSRVIQAKNESDLEGERPRRSPSRRSESPNFVVTLDGVDPNMMKGTSSAGEEENSELELDAPPKNPPVVINTQPNNNNSDMSALQRLGKPLQSTAPVFRAASNVVKVAPLNHLEMQTMLGEDANDIFVEVESNDGDEDVEMATAEERCKFWPSCKAGDSCVYTHPSVPCRNFPRCTFGNKCLYVHPICRYDASCTRPDCMFTHTTRKPAQSYPVIVQPIKMPMVALPSGGSGAFRSQRFTSASQPYSFPKKSNDPAICKFHPKCSDVDCTFFHPLPCKFGISCLHKNTCKFTHPELPSVSKLKWTSSSNNSNIVQAYSKAKPNAGMVISLDSDA